MKINIVGFHGLYSQGDPMTDLIKRLVRYGREVLGYDIVWAQHDYPKLNVIMGSFPWSRDIVRDFMLKCLAIERSDYPDRETIVLCHSNATWGGSRAVGKYYNYPLEKFRDKRPIKIDKLLLFGCTIKRDYDWGRYPDIDVVNFVGTKDRVVWLSKMFRMGWSGRKGFKPDASNLTQIYNPWRHSDAFLPENFDVIKEQVFSDVS